MLFERIKKNDIYMIDLQGGIGREQNKIRPCIVVSNNIGNKYSDLITIAPLTTTQKELPTHAYIQKSVCDGLEHDSMMLGEHMRTIDKQRICAKVGYISDEETQKEIRRALDAVLD